MIKLVSPKVELVPSYLEFMVEMQNLGEKIWEEIIPFEDENVSDFIERLSLYQTNPPAPRVPETTHWAVIGNEVVGRISLRHVLNDSLKEFGGHIGYEVKPSWRGKGVAKTMLKMTLQSQRAKKIGKLLLTCSPENVASNKTILANGGVLKYTRYVEKWERDTNYYWIEIHEN